MTSVPIKTNPSKGNPVASVIGIVVADVEVIAALNVVSDALNVTSPALVVLRNGVISLYVPPFSM